MKFFLYTIILLAVILIGYNVTILNFNNLMEGDSAGAVIAIVASLCVIVLMAILLISKRIAKKHEQ